MKSYTCPRCRRVLSRDCFGNHAGRVDGRADYCKDCVRDRLRDYRATDAGRRNARDAQRRSRARRAGVSRGPAPAASPAP